MKYRIEYISTFHADVLSVVEFLDEYPKKAARVFAKIDKALIILKDMPKMYPIYTDVPSFRFIPVEDYLIFYKINEQSKIIEIHRLIYGRMDVPSQIKE